MSNRATSAKVARSSALDHLIADLGDWSSAPGPVYQRLARAIAGAIERGELAHGARLPSERTLARATWVSRGTAVAAYDVLVGDALAERRPGSGTFVVGANPVLPRGREGSELVAHLAARADEQPDVIDLSLSVLDDPGDLPTVAITTADLAAEVPAGYDPRGLPILRTALAERLSAAGLATTADEVVVTTGAQQAISLAAACWIRPGDTVLVEDPTYPGALAAFTAAGAVLQGVAIDDHGVLPDRLERALAVRPALVYLQSGPHNPTGCLLGGHRRQRVAHAIRAARVPVVEDLALDALAWDPLPPPIAAHVGDHPTAVIGSLGKRFWSGLRVGYVRAPAPVIARLGRIKTTHDLGSSTVDQLLAARLLDHPDAVDAVARRNDELRRRHDLLAGLLAASLPSWHVHAATGGLSRWVRLPEPVGAAFARHALGHGVAITHAGSLSVGGAHADRVRLSVTHPPAVLTEAVGRLHAAWATFSPEPVTR